MELPCNVCGRNALSAASSSLGAVGFVYCHTCLVLGAEPINMWHDTFWCVGGPEHIRKDLMHGACSYLNGKYIFWQEIVESYDREGAAKLDAEYNEYCKREQNERLQGGEVSLDW